MSIALAQSALGSHTSFAYTLAGGGSSTISAALSGGTTAGSLLVIVTYQHIIASTGSPSSLGTSFPSGGSGLTWRQTTSGGFNSGNDRGTSLIFFTGNAPAQSGGTTFTMNVSAVSGAGTGTSFDECAIYEFTGTAASNSSSTPGVLVDANATLANQTASTPHTANLTTLTTDVILATFIGTGSAITAGSGFTLGHTAGNLSGVGQVQYALNVAAGSIATSFTGTQALWGAAAMAFKPPATTGNSSYGFFFG